MVAVWGAVSSRWLIIPRTHERVQDTLVETARWFGLLASAVLIIAMGLLFWRQLADFRDPFVPWREDAAILLGTGWGRTWILGVVGSILMPVLFLAASPAVRRGAARRASWILATVVALAMCAFPALTGHASGSENLGVLLIPADTLHVLAAGSWIGGLLFVLVADGRERRRGGPDGSLLADLVPVFSPVALVSAGVLLATGTVAAFVHVESVDALFASTYGRLLLAKVALVLLVMVLGAINWRRLTPLLLDEKADAPIRRNAIRELVIAQLVIVVTALLVHTSPMGV